MTKEYTQHQKTWKMSLIVRQLVVTMINTHENEEPVGLSSRYHRYSWPKQSLILFLASQEISINSLATLINITRDSWLLQAGIHTMCHTKLHVTKYVNYYKKILVGGENISRNTVYLVKKKSQAIKEHHHFLIPM